MVFEEEGVVLKDNNEVVIKDAKPRILIKISGSE
jgi:hypothetical protein